MGCRVTQSHRECRMRAARHEILEAVVGDFNSLAYRMSLVRRDAGYTGDLSTRQIEELGMEMAGLVEHSQRIAGALGSKLRA